MKPEEITAGIELRIPAGADLTRSLTYYARITRVEATRDGYVHAFVAKTNADGRPTRRYSRRARAYRASTGYAVIDAAQCTLREGSQPTENTPGTPYDHSGLLRPPAAAVGVSAIRGMPDGSMRQYSAVVFDRGWAGVERTVRTLRAVGYIRPSSTAPSYAVLDVLDAADDIIADYDIPTPQAFAFLKRRLGLVVVHPPEQDGEPG